MALIKYAIIRVPNSQIGAIRLDHAGNPEHYELFGDQPQYVATLGEFVELPGVFNGGNNFELLIDINRMMVDVPTGFYPETMRDPDTGEEEDYLISEDPYRVIYFNAGMTPSVDVQQQSSPCTWDDPF